MRKNWLFIILATLLITIQYEANAQRENKYKYRHRANDPIGKLSDDRKLRYADQLFIQGSYFNAIDYYQQLKANDERNPYITYQLAFCYRATRDYVPAAHYYAETYALAKKVYPLSAYYAGQMLKQQGEYVAAIDMFNKFLEDNKKITAGGQKDPTEDPNVYNDQERKQTPKVMKDLKKKAKMEIDGCNMAIQSIKSPQPVTMLNCGPNVNTIYTELSPLPLGDSTLLFSTMGRNAVIESNGYDKLNYKEHFMTSHKHPGVVDSFQWPLPFYDGTFRDPNAHVGNGCYSPGGDRFYFTKCSEGDTMVITCAIYVSKFGSTNWGVPQLVPGNVNEPGSSNTMPWVAKVGKKEILYFSSNRKLQSRGGYDLWYSVIDPRNGSYRRPQNCGKKINTTSDEITPYYDSRENKLYFSTNGLKSMGGFDIYWAAGGPSRFSDIQNMGYPINTSADELYYVRDPLGKPDAYVVSNRIGSYALKNPTCCNDIWRIQSEPKLIVLGKVLSKKTQDLMPQTVVKMVDQKGEMNTYNSEDGNFMFNMSRGHAYIITGDKPGYTSTRASVSTMEIKRSDPDDTVEVTIYLDSIRNSFSVSNIFYDYDKATLRPESVQSLDSVVHFLTDNPSITVEIYSYTDAKGRDEYNMALSQRRAQSVLDYLEKNGIDRGRLTAKGFGAKNPAAPNSIDGKDNPQGRQLNRRTEFRIITDVPTRRVLYNSALPGTMDQQEKNLHVDSEEDDEQP
ncbi:MAG: OmpA family protein [Flavipsychrobacter sp.]|jgi:outer membrane protein OmpA-like peptidoglycan-associated protein|nr:OmpA family protein [Flavipsychrobacter sp.]